MPGPDQILTVAQMRAAEDALIQAGASVGTLMDLAGRGAAQWVWRVAARQHVTVLCGLGNNGGDGYVLAQALLERGAKVSVIVAHEPQTPAAIQARDMFAGEVMGRSAPTRGDVFVDCLFGSALSRPLSAEDEALLARLSSTHAYRIAVDVPSGTGSDDGAILASELPRYEMTLALGAWKFAHMLMPAAAHMGRLHRVDIGVAPVAGAARMIARPRLSAPEPDAHKYTRGLLAIVGGAMPGASVLAATAAQGAGSGYVKIFTEHDGAIPRDLVVSTDPVAQALADDRIGAVLVGPGLGRDARSRDRLSSTLAANRATVLDADALILLQRRDTADREVALIATPHEGELRSLEGTFGCDGSGSKPERARALGRASGMVVVAKGPDTLVATPDGRLACARLGTSWLSTAGSGDVLAGVIASRLAGGRDPFDAACEGVWLHAEAARRCPPAFTAATLANTVGQALAACL